HFQDLSELAHRDEFVDADRLALARRLRGTRRFHLFARSTAHVARGPARRRATHGGHRAGDVGIHRLLIDRAALPFLATAAAIGNATHRAAAATTAATPTAATTSASTTRASVVTTRWTTAAAGRCRGDRPRRETTAAGNGA